MNNKFRETYFFCGDGCETLYEGYTDGQLWNGWDCPRFTLEVGLQIASDLREKGENIFYNENDDTFYCEVQGYEVEYEKFEGRDIEVDGEVVHIYPIGAWSWIWNEWCDYEENNRKE